MSDAKPAISPPKPDNDAPRSDARQSDAMGERLCSLAELDATGAKGITLGEWPKAREFVVVRDGAAVRAYVNRCPHNSGTLETVPDRFLDAERLNLVCSTHGARFRLADGLCISGPCRGDGLAAVAIEVVDGEVRLVSPRANAGLA